MIFSEKLVSLTNNTEVFPINQYTEAILTSDSLTWLENGVKHTLDLDDVVGTSILPTHPKSPIASFVVNAYPLIRLGKIFKKRQRILKEYQFACPDSETRSHWLSAIHNTLQGKYIDIFSQITPRNLHILINPKSGKKKAQSIFKEVSLVWEKSNINLTVTETKNPQHAQEIIQAIATEKLDGIVVIGGDGTIHEVINGLMKRSDWEQAILTPIGVIPAGTGNGLCKTILDLSGEPYDPISAAFLIAKGKIRPLDLILTEQKNRQYYGFLSLSWAFISDVDIESDKLRYLGSLKNDIYALIRMLSLRTYKGKLSFAVDPNWNLSHQNQCKSFDECIDCSFAPRKLPINPNFSPLSFTQIIEDEFVVFWAMNITYASYNIKATPYAHLSDGMIDLLIVRGGISRWQLLLAFLRAAQGEHINLPYVEYYKVSSFYLEPLTRQGILAVDGEQVDYLSIKMQVLTGIANVFCS